MKKIIVAYLAHPVSAPDQAGIDANLASARAWLKWLVDNTDWAISAPWMPYVETLPDTPGNPYRDRGLADDVEMVRRCDLIVLVGGRVSAGMNMERLAAIDSGLPVLDLTRMGKEPPDAAGHRYAQVAFLCEQAAEQTERGRG